jgi:hypothetical protein
MAVGPLDVTQETSGVESMMDIPKHLANAQVYRNNRR